MTGFIPTIASIDIENWNNDTVIKYKYAPELFSNIKWTAHGIAIREGCKNEPDRLHFLFEQNTPIFLAGNQFLAYVKTLRRSRRVHEISILLVIFLLKWSLFRCGQTFGEQSIHQGNNM